MPLNLYLNDFNIRPWRSVKRKCHRTGLQLLIVVGCVLFIYSFINARKGQRPKHVQHFMYTNFVRQY